MHNICRKKIIGISTISSNKQTYITREIANLLDVTDKDIVGFLLNEQGDINLIRNDIIKEGDILSFVHTIKHPAGLLITLSNNVLKNLQVELGDSILFILKDNNIIISNTFLPIGKVLTYSKIVVGYKINIPTIIIEILNIKKYDLIGFINIGDSIALKNLTDKVQNSERDPKIICTGNVESALTIYLKKEIRFLLSMEEDNHFRILDVGDLIWWIMDEYGNIIIKNSCDI